MDDPQKKKSRKPVAKAPTQALLSSSALTDNVLPLNMESQMEFSINLEDHAAAIPPPAPVIMIVPTQHEESPEEPQQEEVHSAAAQEVSPAVLAAAPLPSDKLLIPKDISFSLEIVSEEPDEASVNHAVESNCAASLAPLPSYLHIESPLKKVNDIVDLTGANLQAAKVDVTPQESDEPLSSSVETLPEVPNKNVKDVIRDITSYSNGKTNGIIGGFVVSDADTSLVHVLGEIYSTGYRLVHEPHSNMTLSIGSEYSKVNVDGQDAQDRWVFIQALEVSLENVIDKDTLPLNFMFLESSAVKNFLKRCGNIIINIYLSIYIYLFIYLPIYLFYLYFLFFILLLV